MLLVLLVDIAVVLVKAVWEVVLVVLLVVIAITVWIASFHLRRKGMIFKNKLSHTEDATVKYALY